MVTFTCELFIPFEILNIILGFSQWYFYNNLFGLYLIQLEVSGCLIHSLLLPIYVLALGDIHHFHYPLLNYLNQLIHSVLYVPLLLLSIFFWIYTCYFNSRLLLDGMSPNKQYNNSTYLTYYFLFVWSIELLNIFRHRYILYKMAKSVYKHYK